MITHFRSALIVMAAAVTTGCSQLAGPVCTGEARPALAVDVRDSTTGAPAGRGARIIATTGTLADTLDAARTAHDGPYTLAHERAGIYTVTVEQEGYRTWSGGGIRVTRDECHVRTVSVVARLQR